MRITVFGAGRMGLPLVRQLVTAGHEVHAVDSDPMRERMALDAGARSEHALGVAEVVVTVLPGTPELETVAASLLSALGAGALWIDLTSTAPSVAARLAEAAIAAGIHPVGAAMAGGPDAAATGRLGFFVGGATEHVARAEPILGLFGDRIERVGERVADGVTAKLLVNQLWFGQAVATTEALLLGRALGLDPDELRGILARSAAGGRFLEGPARALLAGDYLETFGLDRVVEELDALSAIARERGVPFVVADTVARLHREALAEFGPLQGELLAAKLLEHRAGEPLRGAPPAGSSDASAP